MSSYWERSDRWNTDQAQTETTTDKEATWKDLGTSMNAISFGFVATAILISMFLIMAIFERLIRSRQSFEQSQNENQVSFGENQQQSQLQSVGKLVNLKTVSPIPGFSGGSGSSSRFVCIDARAEVSYVSCSACTSTPLPKRRYILAFPSPASL